MFIREIRTAGAAFRKTGRLCFLTLKNVTGHGPERQRFVLLRLLLLCGCLSGMLSGCAGRGTEPVLETYVEEAGEEPMQTPGTGRKTEEEQHRFLTSELALKRLFGVIVTDMNRIRLQLYKQAQPFLLQESSFHLPYIHHRMHVLR